MTVSMLVFLSQAYIDACSTSEFKYTKDTPSARLLYANEVKEYKGRGHKVSVAHVALYNSSNSIVCIHL